MMPGIWACALRELSSSCSSCFLLFSSSSLRSCNARWRRKETSGPSCTSPTPRCNNGCGSGATCERRGKVRGRSWPCGSGSVRTPDRLPELALFGARSSSHAPITAVMKGGSQLHCDGLPLVPKHRAQPSLPPPLRRGGQHPCQQLDSP